MTCCYCGGDTAESTTTYVAEIGERIIIIKHVPCEKCTQCGETFYNGTVVDRLEQITKQLEKTLTEIAIVNYSAA